MSTSSSNTTNGLIAANSTSGDFSGGAIAGVVIGALAGIAGVSALTFFLWRRKRNASQEHKKWAETNNKSITPAYDVESKQYSAPSIRELQSSSIVEMPTQEKAGTNSRPVEIEGQPLIGELDGHFYGRELSATK